MQKYALDIFNTYVYNMLNLVETIMCCVLLDTYDANGKEMIN